MRKRNSNRPQKSPPTAWNDAAGWYDSIVADSGSEYHRHVVLPGAIKLLSLRPGMRILDLACGQGVLCRLLREKGASVVGVDASAELIKLARQRSPEEIQYFVRDAAALGDLSEEKFDAIACILALQNFNPLGAVFDGVSACLKDGGAFVAVIMHPCFRAPKYTSWGWDGNAAQYRRVERYLLPRKEPIFTHPGAKTGEYTWTFHRPLQAYVKAMRRAGMLVDAVEEWASHKISEPGPRADAENAARSEIPMFMAIRAIKIAALPASNDQTAD